MTDPTPLFEGTAPYYVRYRPPYPDAVIADLVDQFDLDGTGRLLDLGCGPGTLTIPLAPYFAETVALDPDEGMIAEAKRRPGAEGVRWFVGRAEDISAELGRFRLVTCGSSFHWMDRALVLGKIAQLLEPGGGVALVGGTSGWWDGEEDWQQVITSVIRRYLGDVRRAGWSTFAEYITEGERFQQTLERYGWPITFERGYPVELEWDIDGVIGLLWSTSFAGRVQFGDRVDDFERELRAELTALRPDGRFVEKDEFCLVCGRPPA
jgi:SAM-dependent methyltransferase